MLRLPTGRHRRPSNRPHFKPAWNGNLNVIEICAANPIYRTKQKQKFPFSPKRRIRFGFGIGIGYFVIWGFRMQCGWKKPQRCLISQLLLFFQHCKLVRTPRGAVRFRG